jgi:hypothetical protein
MSISGRLWRGDAGVARTTSKLNLPSVVTTPSRPSAQEENVDSSTKKWSHFASLRPLGKRRFSCDETRGVCKVRSSISGPVDGTFVFSK